jgi:hypothetical protein
MYKYAVITAVDIEVQGINQGGVEAAFAVGHVSRSDVSGLTFDRLKEMPDTTYRVLGLPAGQGRSIIRKSFNASNVMGNYGDARYWINLAQSASTTVVDADEQVIVIGLDNFSSNTTAYTATAEWKITYHIQFFDLKAPASS